MDTLMEDRAGRKHFNGKYQVMESRSPDLECHGLGPIQAPAQTNYQPEGTARMTSYPAQCIHGGQTYMVRRRRGEPSKASSSQYH